MDTSKNGSIQFKKKLDSTENRTLCEQLPH